MAITAGVANSYKADLLAGTHLAADVYKLALYTSAANIGPTTGAYTTTGEVVGTGYTAGGVTLTGYSVTGTTTARLDFANATWPTSTITARGAMLYNSSRSNKCIEIFDFGADITSTAGTFTATMPAAGDATSLLRVA